MNLNRIFIVMMVVGMVVGAGRVVQAAEANLKDYQVVVIQDLEVPSGSPAPESAGMQMAEKAVYQLKRYSDRYHLFESIAKEGSKGKELPSGKKVLIIKGEVKEFTRGSVGRRIGRSFIPGGEFTGSSSFAARYQFIDKDTGRVIYETDLRTTSTGSEDTVEYAMDRNGEALAKVVTKFKGK